jgi:hypothetical protein
MRYRYARKWSGLWHFWQFTYVIYQVWSWSGRSQSRIALWLRPHNTGKIHVIYRWMPIVYIICTGPVCTFNFSLCLAGIIGYIFQQKLYRYCLLTMGKLWTGILTSLLKTLEKHLYAAPVKMLCCQFYGHNPRNIRFPCYRISECATQIVST